MGLALAAAALPANADYVMNMTGPATATPGSNVAVSAVLTGSGPHDSMVWDVAATQSAGAPNPVYLGYLLDVTAYQTGGADDHSIPKGTVDTGRLPADTATPANIHIEGNTRAQGTFFTTGTLATFDFTIPAGAAPGQTYSFRPAPDTFTNGLTDVLTTAGTTLTITVVPEPATLLLLGIGGLAAARRRLMGA